MKAIIRKGMRQLLGKLIGKGSSYKERSYKILKFENEVIIFELSLEWSKDNHMTKMVM